MKHHALPETMTPEALAQWIKTASKEEFIDETKVFFSEEEREDMRNETIVLESQILELNDIKKMVVELLTKGNMDDTEVIIPETTGIKILNERKELLVRRYTKGYEIEETKVYGIPNEDGNMYFFDIEGNSHDDRTRKLSQREVHTHFGMFVSTEKSKKASNQ